MPRILDVNEKRKVVKCKVIIECELDVLPDAYNGNIDWAVEEALSCDLYDYVKNQKIEELETFYETEEEMLKRMEDYEGEDD